MRMCGSHPEEGDDVVLGDGLQESGSTGQRLEASAACREERADHDDPGRRPSQSAHHQIPFNGVSKPARGEDTRVTNTVYLSTCVYSQTESGCTDLSLRTTPSMQAPNKTTLLRSGWPIAQENNTQPPTRS